MTVADVLSPDTASNMITELLDILFQLSDVDDPMTEEEQAALEQSYLDCIKQAFLYGDNPAEAARRAVAPPPPEDEERVRPAPPTPPAPPTVTGTRKEIG